MTSDAIDPHSTPQPSWSRRVNNLRAVTASLDADAELMLRAQEGDPASFGSPLERHRGPVIHFLYRMAQNQAKAEELAQEVFLRVYKSRASYEPTAKFTTWLFRIATHVGLTWVCDGRSEKMESWDDEILDGVSKQVRTGAGR